MTYAVDIKCHAAFRTSDEFNPKNVLHELTAYLSQFDEKPEVYCIIDVENEDVEDVKADAPASAGEPDGDDTPADAPVEVVGTEQPAPAEGPGADVPMGNVAGDDNTDADAPAVDLKTLKKAIYAVRDRTNSMTEVTQLYADHGHGAKKLKDLDAQYYEEMYNAAQAILASPVPEGGAENAE